MPLPLQQIGARAATSARQGLLLLLYCAAATSNAWRAHALPQTRDPPHASADEGAVTTAAAAARACTLATTLLTFAATTPFRAERTTK